MVLRFYALASLVLFSIYTGWTMSIAEQSLVAFGRELIYLAVNGLDRGHQV